MLFDADPSEDQVRKPRYPVKHPYYEDKEAYNLDACIQDRKKPNFGYAFPNITEDPGSSDEQVTEAKKETISVGDEDGSEKGVGFDYEFLKASAISMRREKQFMAHVLKCFTFGRPVRRDQAPAGSNVSKTQEIKSRFNRVRLIRRYFSIPKT